MQRISIDVEPREHVGKGGPLNKLRSDGWVPGVLYGHGKPVTVRIDQKAFKKAIHTDAGTNALFNVNFKGDTTLSIIKEVQRDIFTQEPIHVDFLRINVREKIEVHIPIHTVGESKGVKNSGGVLEHIQREISLRCLPDLIPAHIDVDVSDLDIHDTIKVSDLKLEEGIEILTQGDHIIVNVVPPRVEEEPAPAAAAASENEPELIAKGKKEEEEGATDAKGAKPAPKKEEKK